VEHPGIEPGVPEAGDLQSPASPLMLLLQIENHYTRTTVEYKHYFTAVVSTQHFTIIKEKTQDV